MLTIEGLIVMLSFGPASFSIGYTIGCNDNSKTRCEVYTLTGYPLRLLYRLNATISLIYYILYSPIIICNDNKLLSNYQAEIPEMFTIGEDLAVYESQEDLLCQIGYYLEHDDLRQEIAQNGQKKIREFYSYKVNDSAKLALRLGARAR